MGAWVKKPEGERACAIFIATFSYRFCAIGASTKLSFLYRPMAASLTVLAAVIYNEDSI